MLTAQLNLSQIHSPNLRSVKQKHAIPGPQCHFRVGPCEGSKNTNIGDNDGFDKSLQMAMLGQKKNSLTSLFYLGGNFSGHVVGKTINYTIPLIVLKNVFWRVSAWNQVLVS